MTRSLLAHWLDVHHSNLPIPGVLMAVSAENAGQSRLATLLIAGVLAVLAGEVALATRRRVSGVTA
jgi:hypothetical protein